MIAALVGFLATSSGTWVAGLAGVLFAGGGLFAIGHRSASNAAAAKSAQKDASAERAEVRREQAMLQAQADAPASQDELRARLDKGTA